MSNVAQAIADRCVVSADGCWLWAGSTTAAGYGRRTVRGHGSYVCGERSPGAKLTAAQVLAIRCMQGVQSGRETAAEFRISESQVYRIWDRVRWSHL